MIIGIGGVSRAGKTTLAERLKKEFEKNGQTTEVFCQDDFVKPKISLPKVEGISDWERPSSIKWDLLSKSVEKSEADIKIIEGLFSFYPASLRASYDMKIFIDIPKELFENRRKEDGRWNESGEEEPAWYIEHVWRSFIKYGQMKDDKSEYFKISGEQDMDVAKILQAIPQ